jgi:methylmalonyl-CoA mutase
MYDLLNEKEQLTSRFFGGGGRVILKSLNYKTTITRIYAPDDDRSVGLQGMINDLVERSDFPTGNKLTDEVSQLESKLSHCRRLSA